MHDVIIEYIHKDDIFVTTQDIPIVINDEKGVTILTAVIPKGFRSNLITGLPSSINKILREELALCFLKHDYLYTYKLVSRKIADSNLYQDIKKYLPLLLSYSIRIVCRIFGFIFW